MASGRPLDTDLVYLERDRVQYRVSWYDFQNKIGIEENDLVLIQRDLQYHAVRVGDIWDGYAQLEDTDYFLVERGIRGAFDPDNPDDPAYFPRLYHANPEIGVYIEFELTSETLDDPEVTIRVGAVPWSNNARPRIVTPAGGTTFLVPEVKNYTFQGAGIYGIMGYLTEFQISSPDVIDASITETNLWQDMNSKDDNFGVKLFSHIGKLTGAPERLHIKNADEFCTSTTFDFGADNPFKYLKIGASQMRTSARRAFYNTKGDPLLDNMNLMDSKIDLSEMFAYSDFSGRFSFYGDDFNGGMKGGRLYPTNFKRMFYNAVNYTDDFAWRYANIREKVADASQMFEGATAFNTDLSTSVYWVYITNMHRMFARTAFNGVWVNTGKMDLFDRNGTMRDISEIFAQTPFNRPTVVNLSNVQQGAVNVDGMFRQTTEFNYNFNGTWNFARTKSLKSMFRGAKGITDPGAPPNWDVSHIEDFRGMFAESTFNADISPWDVSSATNMDRMFDNAETFNFDLTGWCVAQIPDEPADFANTAVFPQANHPRWGTCPIPIKQLPVLIDLDTSSQTDGIIGNEFYLDYVGELEIKADTVTRIWQLKAAGETEFSDIPGDPTYLSDRRGPILPVYGDGSLRVKEIHQSTKYQNDEILYSNELAINSAGVRTFWNFDFDGDPGQLLKVAIPYAQVEQWDGAEWGFAEEDPSSMRRQRRLTPGTYRFDTSIDSNWQYEEITNGGFSTGSLTIHTDSVLGAVTNMGSMFFNFTGYPGQDFTWLDVSNVKVMTSTFSRINGDQLDVTGWDVSNVTTFGSMFDNCKLWTGTGIDTWTDAGSATSTAGMFFNCQNMNVDLSGLSMPKVTTTARMFENCKKYVQDPPVMFSAAPNVDATNMFRNCFQFNGDISGLTMAKIANASNMFYDCRKFVGTGFQAADWNGTKLTNAHNMFFNCYQFNQSLAVLPRAYFKKITNMWQTFQECRNFAGEGMAGFEFNNCTRFNQTFYNAGLAGNVDVSGWVIRTNADVAFQRTFYNCRLAESYVGLPQWDTSRVKETTRMFGSNRLLHQDDFAEFDSSYLEQASDMFNDCRVFNADLSSWCVPKLGPSDRRVRIFCQAPMDQTPEKHPSWGNCPPRVISQPVIQ